MFLGMNKAGEKVLEWLEGKEEVTVLAVIEDRDGLNEIKKLRPDIVVSSGYEYIVPKEIIDVPEKGIVNLHPSYLPYNRGAHPYIWPLIDDTPAGVSVHFMNQELDEGPIIARREVNVRPTDDAKSLRDRLMGEQFKLFKDSWGDVLEGKSEVQRTELGNTHYKKELDDISQLDLDKEMEVGDVISLLRGLTYGDKGLATFEEDGKCFSIRVEITDQGSN